MAQIPPTPADMADREVIVDANLRGLVPEVAQA